MIVIAILGILAAAIFPLWWYYLMRARDLARVVDTHNLSKVLLVYEMDYGIFPAHELGCYPHNSLRGYLRKTYISPKWSEYNEGCGSSGMYGYWVSVDGHTALLMAMMENPRGGNYTGSTLWMTGDLTPLGDSNAMNTSKGAGNIYIVKIGGWSGTSTPIPPVPVVIDGSCSSVAGMCSTGIPTGYSSSACGGSTTWTCSGQNSGSDASCSVANIACPANVTATFDGNGWTGHTPTSKVIAYNTAIWTLPSNPSRVWYSFLGWYTAQTWGTQITIDTIMTANTTYYAQWVCNADGADEPACTAVGQVYTASSTRPGCNGPDKVFCVCAGKAQTWSMCNAGSNMTRPTWSDTYAFFQWWNNDAWTKPGHWTVYPDRWIFYYSPFTPWWWSEFGTFLSLGSPSAMRWPCASGYHVPTATEWTYAISLWQTFIGRTDFCEWSHGALVQPNGTYSAGGDSYYWSSTITAPGQAIAIQSLQCSFADWNSFATTFRTSNGSSGGISTITLPYTYGLTVRCIKD